MSESELNRFLTELLEDDSLQQQFLQVSSLENVFEFASENGFELTDEEQQILENFSREATEGTIGESEEDVGPPDVKTFKEEREKIKEQMGEAIVNKEFIKASRLRDEQSKLENDFQQRRDRWVTQWLQTAKKYIKKTEEA